MKVCKPNKVIKLKRNKYKMFVSFLVSLRYTDSILDMAKFEIIALRSDATIGRSKFN